MKFTWIGAAQSVLDVAADPIGHVERSPLTALALAAGVGVLIGARGKASAPMSTALQAGVVFGLHQLAQASEAPST